MSGKTKGLTTLRWLYMLSMLLAFGSNSLAAKLPSAALVLAAALVLRPSRLRLCGDFPLTMLAGMALMLAYSHVIWVLTLAKPALIKAGFVRIIYNSVNIAAAFCAVGVFGAEAVDYSVFAALAANTSRLILALAKFGPARAAADVRATLASGVQTGFMLEMEVQDATYTYGIFILYYLISMRMKPKMRAAVLAGCVFFALVGFKRVMLLSLTLALLCTFAALRLPERVRRRFAEALCAVIMLAAFAYIPFVRSGAFERLMHMLSIDARTRLGLYAYVYPDYSFSPFFIGHGPEFATLKMTSAREAGLNFPGSTLHFIHNDILARYLELGFWGFAGWLLAVGAACPAILRRRCGQRTALLYSLLLVFLFATYAVGNTNRSYIVRLIFIMTVSASGLTEREECENEPYAKDVYRPKISLR